jgi:protein-tyrosine phosphatase
LIDLHNHLLAGIDDGSRDMAETIAMCRIAALDGIREIVATPHFIDGEYTNDPERIAESVGILNERLDRKGIDLRICPGMEVPILPGIPDLLDNGRIMTLNNGRYLLVELYRNTAPALFERLVHELGKRDRAIMLGHPEKNTAIQRDPDYLFEIMRQFGRDRFLVQIAGDSLTGHAGPVVSETARTLLRSNLAHVIASDAHSPILRPPRLSEPVIVAASIVGRERARGMVSDVPRAVLDGTDLPDQPEPRRTGRARRIFGLLGR